MIPASCIWESEIINTSYLNILVLQEQTKTYVNVTLAVENSAGNF